MKSQLLSLLLLFISAHCSPNRAESIAHKLAAHFHALHVHQSPALVLSLFKPKTTIKICGHSYATFHHEDWIDYLKKHEQQVDIRNFEVISKTFEEDVDNDEVEFEVDIGGRKMLGIVKDGDEYKIGHVDFLIC